MSDSLAVQQIFVYGTLMSHFDNPMAFVLERNCQLVGKGQISGKLFHVNNDFPAAIHQEDSDVKVVGQLFTIAPEAHQQVMRLLDQFLKFKNTDPESSLFVRTVLDVDADGHRVPCWVYLYNQPTEDLTEIPSGNYWQFLKEQNLHKKQ